MVGTGQVGAGNEMNCGRNLSCRSSYDISSIDPANDAIFVKKRLVAVLPFVLECGGQMSDQIVRAFRHLKNVPIQSF